MKKMKLTVTVFLATLFVGICALPVQAEPWLSMPSALPLDLDAEGFSREEWRQERGADLSDLCGVYYAVGMGLEMRIQSFVDEFGIAYSDLQLINYDGGGWYNINVFESDANHAASTNGDFALTRLDDGTIQLDLSQNAVEWLAERENRIYLNQTSAVFTDVWTLQAEGAEEDYYWTGTYCDESEYASEDIRIYYCPQRLYGTSDYTVVYYYEQHNVEQTRQQFFYTELDGFLVHEYPQGLAGPSGTTYSCFAKDSDGNLRTTDYVLLRENLAEVFDSPIVYDHWWTYGAWK